MTRQFLRTVTAAAVRAWAPILVMVALAAPAPARALDDSRIAAATKAGAEFLALAAAAPEGAKPRASDPAVAALLDAVFDRGVFGGGSVPVTEARKISVLLENANRVGSVYYLDGTGAKSMAEMRPDLVRRADENVPKYAPEIGAWLDYQILIQIGLVGGTLDFLARATPETLERPNVKNGLDQVRNGAAQMTTGLLVTLILPNLTDEWRLARLVLLNRAAPGIARLLTAEQRQRLRAGAGDVEGRMTDARVKASLAEFSQRIAP